MKREQSWILPFFIFLFIMGVTGCSGIGARQEADAFQGTFLTKKEILSLVRQFKLHRFYLKNGLRLLVVEDHSSPTFAYQTWFRVGSHDEVPGYTGLAHLFEHMMFKETKNLKDGEFDRILESAGAEGENAFTSRDYTAYVQELPKGKLDLIAQLEAERMQHLIVNEKAFKTEREVVQNERRFRNENNPDGLMYQELFGTAFRVHPYRWPVIGYQEDLDRMQAEDALRFYKKLYDPQNAIIVVVGDVEPEEVLKIVQRHYKRLSSQQELSKVVSAATEPEQSSPRRKRLKLNIQVEKLLMGFPIPEVTHGDIAAIEVLANVLAGGKSSRLHRALVETGIANSVYGYNFDDRDPTLFVVGVNLQKNRKAVQAEAIILREMQLLMRQPVSEKELERAKNRLNFLFYEGLNSNSEKAHFLGAYETLAGSFEVGLQKQQMMERISAQEIQSVAQKYLSSNRRSVITGVPK